MRDAAVHHCELHVHFAEFVWLHIEQVPAENDQIGQLPTLIEPILPSSRIWYAPLMV